MGEWVWTTLGVTLAVAGSALAAWALFWDRSRGRKRCPKCWYSMERLHGIKCPECGLEAREPRALLKTRRRWGMSVLGGICCAAGYGACVWESVHVSGWVGAVPTWALIAALPWSEGGGPNSDGTYRSRGNLWQEMLQVRTPQMSGLSAAAIVRLSLRGDSDRPVGSPAWMNSYGYAYLTLDRRGLVREAQQRALWTALVPTAFRTRAHWPRGVTAWLESDPLNLDLLEPYVQGDRSRRVVIRIAGLNEDLGSRRIPPRSIFSVTSRCGMSGWSDGNRPLDISGLPCGQLRAEMEIADIPPDGFVGPLPVDYLIWRTVALLPVVVGGDLQELLKPVKSDALDEAVRSGVRACVLPYCVQLSVSPECRAAFKGVSLAITIEARVGGKVVATAQAWDGPGWVRLDSGFISWCKPPESPALDPSEPGFEIRVRGDGAVALRDFSATRFWDGEVVIPAVKADPPWINVKATAQ